MEPTWAGEPDNALGDGRMVAWSVVYYSTSKDMGMAVIVRSGHDNVCIADPLTANDRVELRNVRSITWTTDSPEAIAAIRAKDATIDRALSQSKNAQVSYGIDLRRSNIWGIKGQSPDQGVTFAAEVSLTSLAVTKVNVSGSSEGPCFKEVPHCLRGPFAAYWEAHGGLYTLGYPITPEIEEKIGGKTFAVQYTQRARLEYHPENKPPHDVLLGLLGNSLVEGRLNEQPFRPTPAKGGPNNVWFSETQHNLSPPFVDLWKKGGGLAVFGYPRSEAFEEVSRTDGKRYLVQYFERNRIEHHPEHKSTPFEFLLGLLGVEQFEKTYGTPTRK
jgi:hypothetical protein